MLLRKWIRDLSRRAEERQTLWGCEYDVVWFGSEEYEGEEDVHDADAKNDE